MDTDQKADLEYLIEESIRFGKEMLIHNGEFFPYSYALKNDEV